VIYRHQVLKQADVVLAMVLRDEHFTAEQKRRNFDYYDPITTGDSSLSACVQSIAAAEVGHADLAWSYFEQALYLDVADTHGNTTDGVHIANAGGIWAAIVHGFAGVSDNGDVLKFSPRLPAAWKAMSFRLSRHGSLIGVQVDSDGATVSVLEGSVVPIRVGDMTEHVAVGDSIRVPASRP
jgi:alpha,alpha-trehalose phosphorylase